MQRSQANINEMTIFMFPVDEIKKKNTINLINYL